MTVNALTQLEFEAKLNQHDIVLVDFWASWCVPCKSFAETYQKVADLHPDVGFYKVNVEEEAALADEFQVRSIPHLMVIKKGVVIYSDAGSMPFSTLNDLVQQAKAADVSGIIDAS